MSAPRPVLGVSACVFRGGEVLLVTRGGAPFAGLLSLPGGKVRFGERLADAVCREVREEAALTIEAPVFVRLHEAMDAANAVHAVIAVFRAEAPPGAEPVAGDDAAAARFVAVEEIAGLEAGGLTTAGLAAVVAAAGADRLRGAAAACEPAFLA